MRIQTLASRTYHARYVSLVSSVCEIVIGKERLFRYRRAPPFAYTP